MIAIPDLLMRHCLGAIMLQNGGRSPSPYLLEKWDFEPGNDGVCRAIIRINDNSPLMYFGRDRTCVGYSPFFERKRFDPFCDYVILGMAKDGYDVDSICQVWLADTRSGGWGILFRVHMPPAPD